MALSTVSRPEDLRGARRLASAVLPAARSGYGRSRFPEGSKIKEHSTEYLRQIYVDPRVFTPEGLCHLVASGVGQIMIGPDYPFLLSTTTVDHVLKTPRLERCGPARDSGETAASQST